MDILGGGELGKPEVPDPVGDLEPHVPWRESFLRQRLECYEKSSHPLAGRADGLIDSFGQPLDGLVLPFHACADGDFVDIQGMP